MMVLQGKAKPMLSLLGVCQVLQALPFSTSVLGALVSTFQPLVASSGIAVPWILTIADASLLVSTLIDLPPTSLRSNEQLFTPDSAAVSCVTSWLGWRRSACTASSVPSSPSKSPATSPAPSACRRR